MELTLEALGLTKEQLQELVIARAADRLLRWEVREDGVEVPPAESRLAARLQKLVEKRIDAKIAELAEAHVLPNVASYIEKLSLQATNAWGEKRGTSVTFIEYLVQRAEAYLSEQVDYEGKGKGERDSYSWKGAQTRLAHMVHKHLHYSIETAMKNAIEVANSKIAQGIAETAKMKLDEISASLRVEVKTKR